MTTHWKSILTFNKSFNMSSTSGMRWDCKFKATVCVCVCVCVRERVLVLHFSLIIECLVSSGVLVRVSLVSQYHRLWAQTLNINYLRRRAERYLNAASYYKWWYEKGTCCVSGRKHCVTNGTCKRWCSCSTNVSPPEHYFQSFKSVARFC